MSDIRSRKSLAQPGTPTETRDTSQGPMRRGGRRNTKPYPLSIILIIAIEFCERYSYGCSRSLLVFFLRDKMVYKDRDATLYYHIYMSAVYVSALIDGLLADSILGKFWRANAIITYLSYKPLNYYLLTTMLIFRTILILSTIYVIGNTCMTLATVCLLPIFPTLVSGLILVAAGTGGIKACCAVFGAEQFQVPGQEKQLLQYYALFYFLLNVGMLVAMLVSPVMMHHYSCFGEEDCYFAPFALSAVVMAAGTVLFACGKRIYVHYMPQQRSTIIFVPKSICHALIRKIRRTSHQEPEEHFMDYVKDVYGESYVNDVKALLKVVCVYISLPIFWALFEQQGSTWALQATRLDSDIGAFRMLPGQVQFINPVLLLWIIPLQSILFNPFIEKCLRADRPLKKMAVGAILMCLAFLCAAALEFCIESYKEPGPKPGYSQLRIFNGFDCYLSVHYNKDIVLKPRGAMFDKEVPTRSMNNMVVNWKSSFSECAGLPSEPSEITLSKDVNTLFIGSEPKAFNFKAAASANGHPTFRILSNIQSSSVINFTSDSGLTFAMLIGQSSVSRTITVKSDVYTIKLNNKYLTKKKIDEGGVYALVISENSGVYAARLSVIIQPNSIDILWMLPQYLLLTLAEAAFAINGLEFVFTEAPETMRSFLQALWLLNMAFGNLIFVIVDKLPVFQDPMSSFLLYAFLMLLDVILLIIIARKYHYSLNTIE